jgi:hypothetical protein
MFIWSRFALLLTCGQRAEDEKPNVLIFIVLHDLPSGGKIDGMGKAFAWK